MADSGFQPRPVQPKTRASFTSSHAPWLPKCSLVNEPIRGGMAKELRGRIGKPVGKCFLSLSIFCNPSTRVLKGMTTKPFKLLVGGEIKNNPNDYFRKTLTLKENGIQKGFKIKWLGTGLFKNYPELEDGKCDTSLKLQLSLH